MSESLGWLYFLTVFFELYLFYILCREDVIEELNFEFDQYAKYIRWVHIIILIVIADPEPKAVLISHNTFYADFIFIKRGLVAVLATNYCWMSLFIFWRCLPFKDNATVILLVLHTFSFLWLFAR